MAADVPARARGVGDRQLEQRRRVVEDERGDLRHRRRHAGQIGRGFDWPRRRRRRDPWRSRPTISKISTTLRSSAAKDSLVRLATFPRRASYLAVDVGGTATRAVVVDERRPLPWLRHGGSRQPHGGGCGVGGRGDRGRRDRRALAAAGRRRRRRRGRCGGDRRRRHARPAHRCARRSPPPVARHRSSPTCWLLPLRFAGGRRLCRGRRHRCCRLAGRATRSPRHHAAMASAGCSAMADRDSGSATGWRAAVAAALDGRAPADHIGGGRARRPGHRPRTTVGGARGGRSRSARWYRPSTACVPVELARFAPPRVRRRTRTGTRSPAGSSTRPPGARHNGDDDRRRSRDRAGRARRQHPAANRRSPPASSPRSASAASTGPFSRSDDGTVGAAVLALRLGGVTVDEATFERIRTTLAALR